MCSSLLSETSPFTDRLYIHRQGSPGGCAYVYTVRCQSCTVSRVYSLNIEKYMKERTIDRRGDSAVSVFKIDLVQDV